MPQPIVRRIAHRAVQLAILAAGIFFVMLVFSRQAHAATDSPPPPGSPVSTASSLVGSTVNAASQALTGHSGSAAADPNPSSTGTENTSSGTGTNHSSTGSAG